jgi:hypothetical protein
VLAVTTEEQLEWTASCFVCQHVARAIEDRLSLYSSVLHSAAATIVADICETMNLEISSYKICERITSGENGIELSFLAVSHRDAMDEKRQDVLSFAEKVCSLSWSLNQCNLWIKEDIKYEMQEERVIEAVYD